MVELVFSSGNNIVYLYGALLKACASLSARYSDALCVVEFWERFFAIQSSEAQFWYFSVGGAFSLLSKREKEGKSHWHPCHRSAWQEGSVLQHSILFSMSMVVSKQSSVRQLSEELLQTLLESRSCYTLEQAIG